VGEQAVNRNKVIRLLREYARKHSLSFSVETKRGKGSHYLVILDGKPSTIQSKLTPGGVERLCKQLGIPKGGL
jgi:RNase P protein component